MRHSEYFVISAYLKINPKNVPKLWNLICHSYGSSEAIEITADITFAETTNKILCTNYSNFIKRCRISRIVKTEVILSIL